MVQYECFRCGYNTKHRNSMKQHLNRKNICNPSEDNVDINEIKKYYGFEINDKNESKLNPSESKMNPSESKMNPSESKMNPSESKIIKLSESKMNPNESKISENESKMNPNESQNIYKCIYCNKFYTTNSNMRKHEKICKKKEESELLVINQNEEIIKMKKEIEELKNLKIQTQNNTTNNNSHNTTNNTININNYGDENLKHLRTKDFAELLQGIYSAVPKLIEKIHFDTEHPENQNIKFTNKKLPYLKILKDKKWQLVHKKYELLDLIDAKCFMLKEKYYKILEKKKYNITETQRNKIEEFMKKYHEEDKKMTLDLIERTELMLLNNS